MFPKSQQITNAQRRHVGALKPLKTLRTMNATAYPNAMPLHLHLYSQKINLLRVIRLRLRRLLGDNSQSMTLLLNGTNLPARSDGPSVRS